MKCAALHILFWFTCCLLPVAGCTGGLIEEPVTESPRFIELRFNRPQLGLLAAPRTKAQSGVEATPLPAGTTVRIAAYRIGDIPETVLPETVPSSADFATVPPTAECTYRVDENGALLPCPVDDDGKPAAGNAGELFVLAGIYDFYALSPARPLKVNHVSSGGESEWKSCGIPHQEDVMTSLARRVTVSQATRTVNLAAFRRKCAQVVFTVAPTKDNIVPISSLCGTRLELTEISSSGASLTAGENKQIQPTGGDASEAGHLLSTDFVPLDDPEHPGSPDPLGLNRTTAILLPKNSSPFKVAVTVARNGMAITLAATISQNLVFEEGKRYIFTLAVENDRSLLRLNVYDWTTFPLKDDNLGGAPSDRPTDPEVTPGTQIGLIVAGWDNIPWAGGGTIGGSPP